MERFMELLIDLLMLKDSKKQLSVTHAFEGFATPEPLIWKAFDSTRWRHIPKGYCVGWKSVCSQNMIPFKEGRKERLARVENQQH